MPLGRGARVLSAGALSLLLSSLIIAGQETTRVQCNSGTLTFASPTNMIGVEVTGKSGAVSAEADVAAEGNQLVLHNLEAAVPVASLATGMKVRDEHMRKYIFRTKGGKEPDLKFNAEGATCAASGAHEYQCPLKGTLEVRGVARPAEFAVKVKEEGAAFHASLDTVIKLSTFGIERPTQFGVRPEDDVKVHVELTGKARQAPAATGAGQ